MNVDTNIEDQPPSEITTTTSNINANRKQDDQFSPEETQDTIPEDSNDTVMEDQNSITLHNKRNQTSLSPPHRIKSKKSSIDLQKTLSRLGKTRK